MLNCRQCHSLIPCKEADCLLTAHLWPFACGSLVASQGDLSGQHQPGCRSAPNPIALNCHESAFNCVQTAAPIF